MTREIIASILEGEGAQSSGGALVVREDREATCFVATPGEVLHVARIVRVELKDKHLTLQTAKDERFAFTYDSVLGFKLAASSSHPKDRAAGFSR
jgi:hypothetical protein